MDMDADADAHQPQPQPHFILVPFMSQGHMIPMIDIAILLARRGSVVTIFTTPLNYARFATLLSRATQSEFLAIQVIQLNFPCEEVGLPKGCENFDMLPSYTLFSDFYTATAMLQKQIENHVREMMPPPNCMIADLNLPWTINVARMFHIPRISFNGSGCFCHACVHSAQTSKILEKIGSNSEYFILPDMPDAIKVTKLQLPPTPDYIGKLVEAAEEESYGVIVNSFEELEPEYVKEYKKVKNNRVWCVGPVSLRNQKELDKAERGNKSSVDENKCMKWLDSWEPNSVVYVCLGSLCNITPAQHIELGLGLEASNKPFIWVIRGGMNLEQVKEWIKEDGFEERTKSRGLLIRGWAPQILILSHPAIGGFLTHGGWNSIMEGICAGVSMITWPLFADQFLNEKLVSQVLNIAVRVGWEVPFLLGKENKIGVLLKREDVRGAIEKLMGKDQESIERRERVRELGVMAKRAVEHGGSSDLNLSSLIQEIMRLTNDKLNKQ